jgi:hypothetical protein
MPEEPYEFTRGQRMHLEVILGSLIAEAEDLIEWSNRVPDGNDPERTTWLSDLRSELATLVQHLRRTVASLGISVRRHETDPRRKVAAWSSTWWAHVLDCRPSHLEAYGPVDPRLGPLLTPAVQEISERLLRLERGAEGG